MNWFQFCLISILYISCKPYQKSPMVLRLEQDNNSALNQSIQEGVERYEPEYLAVLPLEYRARDLKQYSRWYPKNVSSFFTPSAIDLEKLYKNFNHIRVLSAVDCCIIGRKVTLEHYGFQILGVVVQRKNYLYINAISLVHLESRDRPIEEILSGRWSVIGDGGHHFWGVLFNLEDGKFYHLSFNGN